MLKVSIVLCLIALAIPLVGVVAEKGAVPFEDLFDPDRQPKVPSELTWSPQGDRLAYLWPPETKAGRKTEKDDKETGLWIATPARQELRLVVPLEDKPERMIWLPDGSGLLVHQKSGLAHLSFEGETEGEAAGTLRELVATGEDDEDFKLSPDGKTVSFVRHADLWVLDLASGKARRLTEDGVEGEILNGKTDWVYWEELWGRDSTGHWWSPDARRLAFYHFDDRLVSTYPLVDFTQIPYPTIEEQKYPKAGERNPEVKVGILTPSDDEGTDEGDDEPQVVWLETSSAEETYLARVHWLPDGKQVAVERLNREQNRLDLLLCNPDDGSCRVLLTESNDTWVKVGDFTHFLQDGSFLWASQREGWFHLYLYSAEGKLLHRLTPDGRNITDLEAVQEEEGRLIYTAFLTGDLGAASRVVEWVPLRGDGVGRATPLSPTEGDHSATAPPAGDWWVHSFDDSHSPQRRTVRNLRSGAEFALPGTDPTVALRADLPRWETLTIPGPDGPLPARLLKPAGFESGKGEGKYPAIVYHYGCPESQVVRDSWSGRDLWHRWMASRGYAVFMVDNGQSNHFGKAGVDRGHRRFGTLNLAAQLAGVEYLKSLGWVDTDRLGLWGWSGGGANTLYVLTNAPGVFKAGVSGAPVTHWRLYDTIWTERYLDHPEDNPEGYEASSPLTYADRLKDHLLIVHGTADDNVHPQNTLAFTDALIEADIDFEDAIYPRQKHGFRDEARNHFNRRMTEFFDRHLR
jgi:dipeptidyl-peptidase-4